MATSPKILVTGAAGKTGAAAAHALLDAADVQVRAMVRVDDERASRLRAAGAEVIVGNMDDLRDMRRAMSGVQRAYFVAPPGPNSLGRAMNFAVAAEENRLEHMVALTQWLSSPSHPSLLTRHTWLYERVFARIPGVDYTLINVGFFAANFMPMLGMMSQLGVFAAPLGSGNTALISNEDIGRVVAGVLRAPAAYAGRTLRPTGPEVLSPQQMADAFGEVLGRKVRYVEGSNRMFRKSARALAFAPRFAQVQIDSYFREYRRGSFEEGGVTDVVRTVTGPEAEDFTTIVRRYAASDPYARRSVFNTLKAVGQMIRILLTPVPNKEKWMRELGMPRLANPIDAADSADWKSTHSGGNAYGVGSPPTIAPRVDAPRIASVARLDAHSA